MRTSLMRGNGRRGESSRGLPEPLKTQQRVLRPVWLSRRWGSWRLAGFLAAGGLLLGGLAGPAAADDEKPLRFTMVRSTAAQNANCLPQASGEVKITPQGPVERMDVNVSGLPPNTDFDFFVIQVPNTPFGLSWYQGDIETDDEGEGHGRFIGRFNIETFIVAPGTAPAPKVHDADASTNPATAPVHTFHLGLWFNSPADAAAAHCPGNTTPFKG